MSSPHDCSHFLKPNFQKINIVTLVFLSVTLCFEASHFVVKQILQTVRAPGQRQAAGIEVRF